MVGGKPPISAGIVGQRGKVRNWRKWPINSLLLDPSISWNVNIADRYFFKIMSKICSKNVDFTYLKFLIRRIIIQKI